MAAIGTALMGKILGHSEAEKAFRYDETVDILNFKIF
jgi:hypothetical protein